MELSRRTIVLLGGGSIGLVLLVTAWFAWPRGNQQNDDVTEDLTVAGNSNEIKTVQTKDFSLIHIENRLPAERGAHLTNIRETATKDRWLTWGTLALVAVGILAYLGHYNLIRLPKKTAQVDMQNKHEDKIDTFEDMLIAHGYMQEPKRNKRKTKGRKAKSRRKEQKEEQDDETE